MEAVKSGRITKQRLDESALKVLSAKVRLGLNRSRTVDLQAIGEVIGAPEDEEAAQTDRRQSRHAGERREGYAAGAQGGYRSLW